MHSHRAKWVVVLIVFGLGWATRLTALTDKPALSTRQQFIQLSQEFEAAQADFSTLFQAAQTDAERETIRREKSPAPERYAPRFWQLVQSDPSDPAAVEALIWLATRAYQTKEAGQALAVLARDHAASSQVAVVCNFAPYIAESSQEFLQAVLEKNPSREIQAQACQSLYRLSLIADPAEADKYLDRLAEGFGELSSSRGRGTIAEFVKAEREHNQTFGIGKVAPETEGEDIDGTPFKLSDYRGKVVVIDFWGDW